MKKVLFWVGVGLVVATHIYMLFAGLPASMVMGHSIINLVAAVLIVYAKA